MFHNKSKKKTEELPYTTTSFIFKSPFLHIHPTSFSLDLWQLQMVFNNMKEQRWLMIPDLTSPYQGNINTDHLFSIFQTLHVVC